MKNRGHRCWGWGGTNGMKRPNYMTNHPTRAPQMFWITKLAKDVDDWQYRGSLCQSVSHTAVNSGQSSEQFQRSVCVTTLCLPSIRNFWEPDKFIWLNVFSQGSCISERFSFLTQARTHPSLSVISSPYKPTGDLSISFLHAVTHTIKSWTCRNTDCVSNQRHVSQAASWIHLISCAQDALRPFSPVTSATAMTVPLCDLSIAVGLSSSIFRAETVSAVCSETAMTSKLLHSLDSCFPSYFTGTVTSSPVKVQRPFSGE